MSQVSTEELAALLGPVVSEVGLELDDIVFARQDAHMVVRVTVEAPEGSDGLDSDLLGDVSRAISAAMDRADPIDGEYLLEVSTPGAERELLRPAHWRRQIGRLVEVRMRDKERFTGRVLDVDDEGAVLEVEGVQRRVDYGEVKKARGRVEVGGASED
ncbi:MAG: ribosome maturation factor RimP [Actinomycetaceae bacterium]|nr:ribosome maturation factor RimP [Actinomycetaceae bacterium]